MKTDRFDKQLPSQTRAEGTQADRARDLGKFVVERADPALQRGKRAKIPARRTEDITHGSAPGPATEVGALRESLRDATGVRHLPKVLGLISELKGLLVDLDRDLLPLEPELGEPLKAILREELSRLDYMSLLLREQSH